MNFAWPRAEIVMGAAGAVQILHAKTVKAAEDPVAMKELEDDYAEKLQTRVLRSRADLDGDRTSETRQALYRALRAKQ